MAPSPLNPVKFELGVILCVGVLLWLVMSPLAGAGVQVLVLAGYGTAGMLWTVLRARRVLRGHAATARADGAESSPPDTPTP